MSIYAKELTDTLSVWIGHADYLHQSVSVNGAVTLPRVVTNHHLSGTEWDFTGRYKFKEGLPHRMYIEVSYQGWEEVSIKRSSMWDRFWNGSTTQRPVTRTEWINSDQFAFRELTPTYVYSCNCNDREPEVIYE